MRELAILGAALLVAIGLTWGLTRYVQTDATGAPMDRAARCPWCATEGMSQTPNGKFEHQWKCPHCLRTWQE